MQVLACLLSLACQPPSPPADDVFARLGLEADVAATVSAWRLPPARLGLVRPALAQQVGESPARAVARAEAFVRVDALADIRPAPLLRAAGLAFGCPRTDKEKEAAPRMDARAFEDLLERAHREIVRAVGSGREPSTVVPLLQEAVDRVLRPGAVDAMPADERAALRELCERAGKVDMAALTLQAGAIVRAALAFAEGEAVALTRAATSPGTRGVTGGVVFDRSTPFGRFVVGGTGRNEYECEQLAVIVDLGGDDAYRGPVAGAGLARRLSVVMDLAGNDGYHARNDGLGAAALGIGVLIDVAGNDRYEGDSRCAGFGVAGIGALFDLAGDDELVLGQDGGGVGFAGLGVYLDVGAGRDPARVGPRTLGCGLPGGVGLFVDDGGDDVREVRTGDDLAAAACGIGLGVHGWLAGGVGLFVDVGGVDHYTGGNSLCGAGSGGGVGIFFEAAGNDTYAAGEFSNGSGRDHGCGLFIDAVGDDSYRVAGPSLGCAAGAAFGCAEDRAGQDLYEVTGAWPGGAAAGALGVFADAAGEDHYRCKGHAVTWPASVPVKSIALSVHEDRGGARDVYDAGESVPPRSNDATNRQRASGATGDVVSVFVDR